MSLSNEPAPAKLNLYLHVVGRRADGYHLLDSLVAFTAAGDVVRAEPAETLSLDIDGPFAEGLSAGDDNLVLKAARALAAETVVTECACGAALTLTKNLPVASGIGGGSADAAGTLRLLSRLWRIDPPGQALALMLGADVPVCLGSRPAFLRGIGEQLSAAPALPPAGLVLVNPRIPLSTPEVFRRRQGPFSDGPDFPSTFGDAAALARALSECRNDLEAPAIDLVPAIATILDALRASPGCRLARLSGSGATCFGLYDDAGTARRAAAWLSARHKGWWVQSTSWFTA